MMELFKRSIYKRFTRVFLSCGSSQAFFHDNKDFTEDRICLDDCTSWLDSDFACSFNYIRSAEVDFLQFFHEHRKRRVSECIWTKRTELITKNLFAKELRRS